MISTKAYLNAHKERAEAENTKDAQEKRQREQCHYSITTLLQ